MNLLAVHKLMVATAILFCAGFAVREFVIDGALPALFGVLSGAGAVALGIYLRWLVRTKGQALDAASRRNDPRDN